MRIVNWVKSNPWLVIILFVAAFLRFYRLDFQSPWLDELHTLNEANPSQSLSGVYQSLMRSEPHPPLYFYVIYVMFKIFGYSIVVVRIFSAVIGLAGVWTMFLLGKELYNRQVGFISALLIAINLFHIHYSQDGRPYSLLFFGSALSFLLLVKFLKKPTLRNSIYYGIGSVIMLYGHFFGLFALFAQYLILLFFLVILEKNLKKQFFILSMVGGLTSLILFLPSLGMFIQTAEIKSIWITMPTPDVYTKLFEEFFGASEIIVLLVTLPLLLYFIKLASLKDEVISSKTIVQNELLLTAIIIIPWIAVVLIIPLIRSYTALPLIVSRYFISILPAVILLIAIGIFYIRNRIVRSGAILLIAVFSITQIFIVKKYYSTINKTQFREVSRYMIENSSANVPIISSLSWYYGYFIKKEDRKLVLIDDNLESYVNKMMADTTLIAPFWYADAHGRPYNLSEQAEQFLNKHFVVEENVEYYDAWARYYAGKSASDFYDISKYDLNKKHSGDEVNYNIEIFEITENAVSIKGWIYFIGQEAKDTKLSLLLIKDGTAMKTGFTKIQRDDVTRYFKSDFDLKNSGFSATIDLSDLEAGSYTVALEVVNLSTNKKALVITDKNFQRN